MESLAPTATGAGYGSGRRAVGRPMSGERPQLTTLPSVRWAMTACTEIGGQKNAHSVRRPRAIAIASTTPSRGTTVRGTSGPPSAYARTPSGPAFPQQATRPSSRSAHARPSPLRIERTGASVSGGVSARADPQHTTLPPVTTAHVRSRATAPLTPSTGVAVGFQDPASAPSSRPQQATRPSSRSAQKLSDHDAERSFTQGVTVQATVKEGASYGASEVASRSGAAASGAGAASGSAGEACSSLQLAASPISRRAT